jgi:hypothetical protein
MAIFLNLVLQTQAARCLGAAYTGAGTGEDGSRILSLPRLFWNAGAERWSLEVEDSRIRNGNTSSGNRQGAQLRVGGGGAAVDYSRTRGCVRLGSSALLSSHNA